MLSNRVFNDVLRTAAHTYRIDSASSPGESYVVYVESINPRIYRCQCLRFIFTGACKHGARALLAERNIKRAYPLPYAREKRAQRKHLAKARMT